MTGINIWGSPGLGLRRLSLAAPVTCTPSSWRDRRFRGKDQFKVTQAVRGLHEDWYDARWRVQAVRDREQEEVDKTSPKRAVRIEIIDWHYPDGRISHAMYLMQTTELSVTQIAYEIGFVEILIFEREFKKYTLLTPKEFKNSLRPD